MITILLAVLVAADDFDRLEGRPLADVTKTVKGRDRLSSSELGRLPNVLAGVRSPVVIVKTDEGNYCRMLVSPALRKAPGGKGEPVPILVIERFDTFEYGPATKKIARGRDLTVFDGFRVDLDSGGVVPEGQGEDIVFQASGDGGPKLVGVKPGSLFTLEKNPLPEAAGTNAPSAGRTVLPKDFAGAFRLFANGQTSGRLDLTVDEDGVLGGRFRSDQTGGSYKVSGQAAAESPNRVRFSIDLPRARQEFDGYLFGEGKGAITGSYDLQGHAFGFLALRDGGRVAPDEADAAREPIAAERPGQVAIDVAGPGRFVVEGKTLDAAALVEMMKKAVSAEPSAWALVRARETSPIRR